MVLIVTVDNPIHGHIFASFIPIATVSLCNHMACLYLVILIWLSSARVAFKWNCGFCAMASKAKIEYFSRNIQFLHCGG